MKPHVTFSEPTKSEFRGKRNTQTKDKHREPLDHYIDGNMKKHHRYDQDDLDADMDDLLDLDPSFDWSKIR